MSNNKGKRYDQEFKQDALRLVERGRPVSNVAADLGLNEQTLYRWMNEHKAEPMGDKARIAELEAELKGEKRKVADLEETVVILKKATAIFAAPRK